jgi:protein involved in sex pheromone biosynthesis
MRRTLLIAATALGLALAACSSGSGGLSAQTTCQQWLSAQPSQQVAFIQAGTNPTVSSSFARLAAKYASAVCSDAPNSPILSAEGMVDLATAAGHGNLYG